FGRTRLLTAETFPRSAQPFGFGLCVFECVSGATVLHHHLAHYEVGVGVMTFYLFCGDDEAEIADVAFDAAEAAVTVRVEVDLACAGRDARVSQVCFEGN